MGVVKTRKDRALFFVIAFSIAGVVALLSTKAAPPSVSMEVEVGTKNGVQVVSDNMASGGNYIGFGPSTGFNLVKSVTSDTGNVALFWDQANIANLDHYEVWRGSTKVGSINASQVNSSLVGNKIGVGGVNANNNAAQQQTTDIQNAGFGWVRINLHWWITQNSSHNSFDWSVFDNSVDLAGSHGLKVIGLIAYTPPWARVSQWQDPVTCNLLQACKDGHVPPANLQDYADFARAAAARYGSSSNRQYKVTHWEIWNEPNISGFWSDSPSSPNPNIQNYTDMLKLSYTAIKSADPSATVISAGLSPSGNPPDGSGISPANFLAGIYQNGGKGYFDAIGMHPYADNLAPTDPSTNNNYHNTYALRYISIASGEPTKPIWGTEAEYSVGTCPGCVPDDLTQANYEAEMAYNWWAFSYSGPFAFWRWKDAGTNPAVIFQTSGFVHQDLTPRLSAYVINRVNHQLVFVDDTAPSSGTFNYQIRAVDSSGQSFPTNTLSVTKQ